eukprot:CAMPEP_0118984844 /NCGR_PEP_ID=MMETSP1173-20130426/38623_1 /TAXON_ID=1034831 /ORGANISM="Rhizochromulina marina cf, Strain CCMP1243" /LENGTH=178 /DNA_ID=CAMNT_0006935525 /DNA_START=7 /DNA_END=543 /DNA_ORIENTATION=-
MSSGYGICGHLNSYNAGVRQGNWVEDQFGLDIAANRRGLAQSRSYQTETQQKYPHPDVLRQREREKLAGSLHDPANAPKQEAPTSRMGLPKSLLFNHGVNIFEESKNPSSEAFKERMRKRQDQLERERQQTFNMQSEAQAMNERMPKIEFKIREAEKPVSLPNFARVSTFSRSELLDH